MKRACALLATILSINPMATTNTNASTTISLSSSSGHSVIIKNITCPELLRIFKWCK